MCWQNFLITFPNNYFANFNFHSFSEPHTTMESKNSQYKQVISIQTFQITIYLITFNPL